MIRDTNAVSIGNPGSLLWLTTDRPHPDETCAGVDSYKYGLTDKIIGYALGDASRLGRDELVQRYFGRKVHYAWGTVSRITTTDCFVDINACV
jgi:hypothetical protein